MSDFIEAQMQVWGTEDLHDSRNPKVALHVRKNLKILLRTYLKEGLLLDVGGYRGLQVDGLNAVVHDMSRPALKDATTRIKWVSCGDIHYLPYADNSFDVVLSSHVLEHSHRPDNMMREMQRVLKKEGKLVIVVPNAAGFGQLLKLFRHGDVKPAGNPPWEPVEHLHHFSKQNAIQYFQKLGWQIERFEGDIFDFPLRDKLNLHSVAAALGRKCGRFAESLIFVLRQT